MDRLIPKIKIKDGSTSPWIDGEVVNLSNKKETKRRKAKHTGQQRHWDRYKEYTRRLKDLIHRKFNNYVANCTDELAINPNKFWTLVGNKIGDRGYPEKMKLDMDFADQDQTKAELFNKFFTSVFSIPDPNEELPEKEINIHPLLENIILEMDEVKTVLKNLDPRKSLGPDNISPRILMETAEANAEPLTKILNYSLNNGTIPDLWKLANVCPIHKKGEKEDMKNYRPISLLCVVSKVMERCIFNRIIGYIQPQITELQHGFCAGKSTTTQLLEVYNSISEVIDQRGQVDTLFLDLSKAFDTVSHPHLVLKLQNLGLNGRLLEWFKDYLHNRKQQTCVNGELSSRADVTSGVPQGSILGPLLFLIYINDMPDVIHGTSKIALYADDSKIYNSINSDQDCINLQEQLENLVKWSETWKLNFNAAKCKIMSITRKILPYRYNYNIRGIPLERVTTMMDLGVTVQDNLLWDLHIRNIVNKAHRNLFFIKRSIGCHAPSKAKLTLYTSLVRSQLEYASIIWAPTTKENIILLERIQKRATKYICNYRDMTYRERLQNCKLVPLAHRREILDCTFAHKARDGLFGQTIKDICLIKAPRHNVRLDPNNTKIQPKAFNTETFGHFYSNRLPQIWNTLPTTIRDLTYILNSSIFKNRIRKHYSNTVMNKFVSVNPCTWVTKCRCPTCRI